MDESLRSRFLGKYSIDRDSGCWNWKASLAGKGYGQLKATGGHGQLYAHRVSYQIHFGDIPEGKSVLHRCDNPKCVNPDHLFIGTKKDNAQDMKSKGRHLYGERNGSAILSSKDVLSIKKLLSEKVLSQSRIGELFGISQIEVSRIHRGIRWAHINKNTT